MARNYYTLVAGLRELTLDAENKGFDAQAILEEIQSDLSDTDRGYLRLFYNYYDIENILNILAGRRQFSALGTFTREQLEEEIANPEKLPDYIADVLTAYNDPENTDFEYIDRNKAIEKSLFEAYYDRCTSSGCRFLRQWAEFDRNLRNVGAAYTARRMDVPVADVVVGNNYVTDTLARSSAADFGLKGELDYIDDVMAAVSEEGNLLDKERRIDNIRWEISDELTERNYFDIDFILGYLVKVNIIHRWVSLDPAIGREMFRKLIDTFTSREMIEENERKNEK